MCCLLFHRFRLGYYFPCAVLQIPHVCSQITHAHDGGLLRDTGRTRKSLFFNFICNSGYFCRRKHKLEDCFPPYFCPVAILMVKNDLAYTSVGDATEKSADTEAFLNPLSPKIVQKLLCFRAPFSSDMTK